MPSSPDGGSLFTRCQAPVYDCRLRIMCNTGFVFRSLGPSNALGDANLYPLPMFSFFKNVFVILYPFISDKIVKHCVNTILKNRGTLMTQTPDPSHDYSGDPEHSAAPPFALLSSGQNCGLCYEKWHRVRHLPAKPRSA